MCDRRQKQDVTVPGSPRKNPCNDTSSRTAPTDDVIRHVLHLVDVKQRFSICALVCHSWHAAALATVNSVGISFKGGIGAHASLRATRFEAWLRRHGHHVGQLILQDIGRKYALYSSWIRANGWERIYLQLPTMQLLNLQELGLIHTQLLAEANSTVSQPTAPAAACSTDAEALMAAAVSPSCCSAGSSPLSVLPRLTSLHICAASVCTGSLCCLTALSGLKQLTIDKKQVNDRPSCYPQGPQPDSGEQQAAQQKLDADIQAALQHLVQLTSLQLKSSDITDAGLAAVSCLQQLQTLDLRYLGVVTASSLAALPTSLTKLDTWGQHMYLSSSRCPRLSSLTKLRHLCLHVAAVQPVLLADMVQLTHLSLATHDFTPSRMDDFVRHALPSMLQLRHLTVDHEEGWYTAARDENLVVAAERAAFAEAEAAAAATPAQPEQYTALTASSHLTSLQLHVQLPAGSGRFIFAEGKQLPHLQHLVLPSNLQDGSTDPVLAAGDIARLTHCCTGLVTLDITGSVQPGVDMTALTQLTKLTELTVGGDAVDDAVAEAVLARMQQLLKLAVKHSVNVTDVGVYHLTQLTILTDLHMDSCGWSDTLRDVFDQEWRYSYDDYEDLRGHVYLYPETVCENGTTRVVSVAQKLGQLCRRSKACLRYTLRQLDEQLADIREERQQRVSTLQQKLAAAQALIAQQRLQLTAAHAAVSEPRHEHILG